MPNEKLDLTAGERLFIWRRRLGLGQEKAAEQLSVSVDHYRDWETDKRPCKIRKLPGELTPVEKCLIKRHRKGWTQKQLAEALRCSRLWVVQMEKEAVSAEKLRDFWGV